MIQKFLNSIYTVKEFIVEFEYEGSSLIKQRFGVQKSLCFSDVLQLIKELYDVEHKDDLPYMVNKILKNRNNAKRINIVDKSNNNITWSVAFDNKKINSETAVDSFTNSTYVYQMFITQLNNSK